MRVVIADDAVLLREGAARILADAGMDVVAQAGDADELLRVVRAERPDVAIVDIRMPPGGVDDGLRAAERIRAELPATGVLILSGYVEERYVTTLLEHGAEGVGYLLKDRVGDVERFTDAIERVAEGGSVLDPEVVTLMLGRRRADDPVEDLNERHVTAIFQKLDLPDGATDHRRVLAVLRWLQREP